MHASKYLQQSSRILKLETAQTINIALVFVYIVLKIFFKCGVGVYDCLFTTVNLLRLAARIKEFGDSGLLGITGFVSAFLTFALSVEGEFVRPAVVTFMALALTGNAFLYFDIETTWTSLAAAACFVVAVLILSQPDDKENEIHAKNRVWCLGFFGVQALGAFFLAYKSYRKTLTLDDQLMVAMLTRFFIMIVCVAKTFDTAENVLEE